MSRNAKTFSDSKSLKEGMSPGVFVSCAYCNYGNWERRTFHDLAEDTRCHFGLLVGFD